MFRSSIFILWMQKFHSCVGNKLSKNWNFKIDSRDKILEIESKVDGSMMKIKMVDTSGGHYGIILETKVKPSSSLLFVEDAPEDIPVLFLEDERGDLCSFKAVRKVHEINRHKNKDQLIAAYNNVGWMSPNLVTIIKRVVND